MTSASFESILREVEQLTLEEQRLLRDQLNTLIEQATLRAGATFVAYLESIPFDETDRRDVERMAQAIEKGCERIESNGSHSASLL